MGSKFLGYVGGNRVNENSLNEFNLNRTTFVRAVLEDAISEGDWSKALFITKIGGNNLKIESTDFIEDVLSQIPPPSKFDDISSKEEIAELLRLFYVEGARVDVSSLSSHAKEVLSKYEELQRALKISL